MRRKITLLLCALVVVVVLAGCVSQEQYDQVKAQNRIQQQRISELESDKNLCELQLNQLQGQTASIKGKSGVNLSACEAEISALEQDIENKKALIAQMQAQLLRSGAELPMELSVKLQDFAEKYDMVDFDESTGMLQFESDLTFDLGSANVTSQAASSIQALAKIINDPAASDFDLIIAGHTDNVPIKKPSTKQKHPTNWHLSAHRAISVLNVLTDNNVESKRLSVRGFGQYRPETPNKPGNKGARENRRVEIYLVPAGV